MIYYKISIIFERIPDQMVVGYEILKNIITVDPITLKKQIKQKRIAFIPDNGPNPVLTNQELILDDSYAESKVTGNLKYIIPHTNIIIDKTHGFELYADGAFISSDAYILNLEKCYLIYYSMTEMLPVITAKYFIDAIEYKLDITDSLSYTIVPSIDETLSVIGRHNELI